MAKISARTREELVHALNERYRNAAKPQKHRILDEFVALTGYHRKHAIRVLCSTATASSPSQPRRPARVYDDAAREALVVLWEAGDRVCGKRLKALLPVLVPALERHGHLELFERLQQEAPGVFPDVQLRTLQRRVKEWRTAAGRRLVFAPYQSQATAQAAS